jgi:hypothetical protein
MSYASKIVERFGGTRAMAQALGFPPSTVQSWKAKGRIPGHHQILVLKKARERGIPLTYADLFDEHLEPLPQGRAAAAP